MSSCIKCMLKIKNLEILKRVLTNLNLNFQEGVNLPVSVYKQQGRETADLVIDNSALKKIQAGRYGGMGFKFNETHQYYEAIFDHYDQNLLNKINQQYAVETIKDFAVNNRKNYEIIQQDDQVILEVYR